MGCQANTVKTVKTLSDTYFHVFLGTLTQIIEITLLFLVLQFTFMGGTEFNVRQGLGLDHAGLLPDRSHG
jgi:hypothetical protein